MTALSRDEVIRLARKVGVVNQIPDYAVELFEHFATLVLASQPTPSKCECTMSKSVLGDGCRYCQPQDYIDRLHNQIDEDRAELASQSAQVPGWQLVPIEPTVEMLSHGDAVFIDSARVMGAIGTKSIYRAMLAAAPKDHHE